MPNCSPCVPQPNVRTSGVALNRNPSGLLEPNFPENVVKWNKTVCTPCKGIYTWVSTPKAMYNNRKIVKNPSK